VPFLRLRYNDQVIYQETFNGTSVDRYTTPESKRAFVYLGDELVGTVINGTEARYYVNDHLGTTELVTDANGNIISRIEHTPFGEAVQVQSGIATGDGSEDYFFTGKEKDATGLYYFGGRYYDPEIGQFISEDPGQDGVNWYSYCRNYPVSYFDPDGWYTSPWYLRSTVPGQTSWDNALTALENRRYGEAVAWTGAMLGEQIMFVWTLGESQAALRAGAIIGSTATKQVAKTTIWNAIKGTQPVYKGTVIPRSFELTVGKIKFWVHPNATEHMYEYIMRNISHSLPLRGQTILSSFEAAVNAAIQRGIVYGKIIRIGNWELIFSEAREIGNLPVIKHALYIP
jgi:RHS repeat-associated protein